MKFIQIAGTARSGKTTTILNLRNELGVLYEAKEVTYIPESKILFIGPGLRRDKFVRKVGTDKIARKVKKLELFLSEDVLGYYPDDTIVVIDTFIPILNSPLLADHERIVKFCETSKAQYKKRTTRRSAQHYLDKQEKYLNNYKNDSTVDLTIWPSTMPLQSRLQEAAKEIGLEKISNPIINFRDFFNKEVL